MLPEEENILTGALGVYLFKNNFGEDQFSKDLHVLTDKKWLN